MSDKQPTATLTEVKNEIGKVFSQVDKHGEVIITYYKKPKYKLVALDKEEKEQLLQTRKKSEQAESDKVVPPAPPVEIEDSREPVPAAKPASVTKPEAPKQPEPTIETHEVNVAKLFAGVKDTELWDRNNKRELLWLRSLA